MKRHWPGDPHAFWHVVCCDPITLALAASAAVSSVGSIVAGNQAAAAANAQAQANDNAAKVAETEASINEAAVRNQNKRLLGKQIAGNAANGVELSGSPLDFTLDSLVDAEMEALTARYQGQTQGNNLRTQASMDRYSAKAAKTNGYLGGAAALISGGADVFKSIKKG